MSSPSPPPAVSVGLSPLLLQPSSLQEGDETEVKTALRKTSRSERGDDSGCMRLDSREIEEKIRNVNNGNSLDLRRNPDYRKEGDEENVEEEKEDDSLSLHNMKTTACHSLAFSPTSVSSVISSSCQNKDMICHPESSSPLGCTYTPTTSKSLSSSFLPPSFQKDRLQLHQQESQVIQGSSSSSIVDASLLHSEPPHKEEEEEEIKRRDQPLDRSSLSSSFSLLSSSTQERHDENLKQRISSSSSAGRLLTKPSSSSPLSDDPSRSSSEERTTQKSRAFLALFLRILLLSLIIGGGLLLIKYTPLCTFLKEIFVAYQQRRKRRATTAMKEEDQTGGEGGGGLFVSLLFDGDLIHDLLYPLLFLHLYALGGILFIPAPVMSIAAGAIFFDSFPLSVTLILLGSLLGASGSFFLSRFLLRHLIVRHLVEKRPLLKALDRA
ncbi:snare associated golgi protein, partial [Cystoisospora suis]